MDFAVNSGDLRVHTNVTRRNQAKGSNKQVLNLDTAINPKFKKNSISFKKPKSILKFIVGILNPEFETPQDVLELRGEGLKKWRTLTKDIKNPMTKFFMGANFLRDNKLNKALNVIAH